MPIAYVQSAVQPAPGSATFINPNAAGNCIVVFIAAFNTGGGGSAPTVSDTQGNTYTQVGGVQLGANSGNWSIVFVAKNIIGGAGNAVTYSTTGFGTLKDLVVAEYSGAGLNAPILSTASTYVGVAGTISVSILTRPSDLVILFCVEDGGPAGTTPPAGFTFRNGAGALPAFIYDGPPAGAGTNPYAIVTTNPGGGSLWAIALDNPTTPRSYNFEM